MISSVGGAVGLAYGYRIIEKHAMEVSHKKVDATASNGNFAALKRTQTYLQENKDVLEKIGLLKSTSEFPEFRIVDEIRKIAAKNNVQIASFAYSSQVPSAATPATPTTPTTTTTTPATPSASAASSSKTIALSVTLSSSSYLDFLQFTYDIEQNLPKMKIKGIGITNGGSAPGATTQGTSSQSSGISIEPVVVEMYIN
jgi:hypothetical protein